MLTGAPDDGGKRDLSLGFSLSILFHAILLPLLLWLALLSTPLKFVPPPEQSPEHLEIESSAVQVDQPPKPRPREAPPKPNPVQQAAQPRQQQPHRLLAVLVPKGPPAPVSPRKLTFSDQLAMQEEQFARTASKLHNENNPLAVSNAAPTPSSLHRSYMDSDAATQQEEGYYAVLIPTQHWFHDNESCYYTRYRTEFGNGGSESGTIPWPICYPRDADRMLPLNHPHSLPVPYPPASWQLPSDTYITPWLQKIYAGRS